MRNIIYAPIVIATLAGCTCYNTTLINSQGQMVTCETRGKDCSFAGYRAYEECVREARAKGYREVPYSQHQEYPK